MQSLGTRYRSFDRRYPAKIAQLLQEEKIFSVYSWALQNWDELAPLS
jgi:hypothetical protein